MEGANIVPVMDMNRNNNYGDCWGGGMWFMWIIVLFALMGGWGGNWNNRGNMGAEIFANGSMTRDQWAADRLLSAMRMAYCAVQPKSVQTDRLPASDLTAA